MKKEIDYIQIISELRKLSFTEISKKIDDYYKWKDFGNSKIEFLRRLSVEAYLNSTIEVDDNALKFIEKYCDKKVISESLKSNFLRILRSWQLWGVALATIAMAAIEVFKFILDYFCFC